MWRNWPTMSWAKKAIDEKSLEDLKLAVTTGSAKQLDATDDDSGEGETPLVMCVAVADQHTLVRYLLSEGADPSKETSERETPLERAEEEQHEESAALLRTAMDEQAADRATLPLRGCASYAAALIAWAREEGDVDLRPGIRLLNARREPDEVEPGGGGKTALMHACEVGALRKARLLISKGANKSAHANSDPNHTALYFAMRAGQPEVVEWLR